MFYIIVEPSFGGWQQTELSQKCNILLFGFVLTELYILFDLVNCHMILPILYIHVYSKSILISLYFIHVYLSLFMEIKYFRVLDHSQESYAYLPYKVFDTDEYKYDPFKTNSEEPVFNRDPVLSGHWHMSRWRLPNTGLAVDGNSRWANLSSRLVNLPGTYLLMRPSPVKMFLSSSNNLIRT